jgi:hypothetical protein
MIREIFNEKITSKYMNIDSTENRIVYHNLSATWMEEKVLNLNYRYLSDLDGSTMHIDVGSYEHLERIHNNAMKYFPDADLPLFSIGLTRVVADSLSSFFEHFDRIIVIGAGGYMANLWYMIKLFLDSFNPYVRSGVSNSTVFSVYDDDVLTMDNLYRIIAPIDFAWVSSMGEAKYDSDSKVDNLQIPAIKKVSIFESFGLGFRMNDEYFSSYEMTEYSGDPRVLVVGSPDIETREMLHEKNVNFIFFGHHGYETQLIYQPKPDADLAVETYGKIDINAFLAGIYMSVFGLYNTRVFEEGAHEPGEVLHSFNAKVINYKRKDDDGLDF